MTTHDSSSRESASPRESPSSTARESSASPSHESRESPSSAREPGKRLFVGMRVSVATANALAGAAETLARRARDANLDIRWVAPVSYHVTLKFLGWTRAAAIGAVRDALVDAATFPTDPRMVLKCARVGAFSSTEKANVVWAGIEEQSGALAQLAKRIDDACARLGFAADKRAFHPHVTLGRLRETRPVREVVLPLSEQMFGDTRSDSLLLFESETKPIGSVYREVMRIPFKTAVSEPKTGSERQSPSLASDAQNASVNGVDTDDGWPRGHHHDDL